MSVGNMTGELKKMFEDKDFSGSIWGNNPPARPVAKLFKPAGEVEVANRPDNSIEIQKIKTEAIAAQRNIKELMDRLYDIDEREYGVLKDMLDEEMMGAIG